MRVTKFEHSLLILEEGGRKLVIDPGGFSTLQSELHDVDAIVVTHEHADHWTPEQITAILATNPGIPIYGPAGFAAAADMFSVETVTEGDTKTVGPFELRFFGTKHAVLMNGVAQIDNSGVLVNGTLFHPGDSYTVPDVEVDVLAAPVGAPWLKLADMVDYVHAVAPKRIMPIHEMTISEAGFGILFNGMKGTAESHGGTAFVVAVGDSLEL